MKSTAHIAGVMLLALAGCDGRVTDSEPPTLGTDARLRQEIGRWGVIPMGDMPEQSAALVTLGRFLFFDKILSGNRDVSCGTCHQPAASLSDGLSLPVGTGGVGSGAARVPGAGRTFISRHAPSLLNSGLGLFYMFWDGRLTRFAHEPFGSLLPLPGNLSNILIGQAMLTVLNRQEMRGDAGDVDVFGNANELGLIGDQQPAAVWQAIMKRLTAVPEYVALLSSAYPGTPVNQLTFEDAARALAAFQMQAFTKTGSPFDRYLNRDNAALTAEQKRGALLFFGRAQCGSCHNGPFLGGQNFANVGVPQIGPGGTREPPLDLGRGELPNNEFYRFAFRVPPLRNVELTAPYMHNGAYGSLEAVIRHYNNVPQALRTYDVSQLAPALRPLHHGDDATLNAVFATLDPRLRTPLNLSDDELGELLAFLKALTDPAARNLGQIVPGQVPSGLPIE